MSLLTARLLSRLLGRRQPQLFLDFDGTLSEHHPDGGRATIYPGVRASLAKLASRWRGGVTVVSGRSVRDLKAKIGVKRVVYVGNHGLEIRGAGDPFLHPLRDKIRQSVRAAALVLRASLRAHSGAVVDVNGLSLSVNVGLVEPRRRGSIRRAIDELREELSLLRLRRSEGHLGWDFVPDVGWDKGSAVTTLLARRPGAAAIAIGDGVGDEAMFRAVGPDGVSVRVGAALPGSAARFRLDGVPAVARLLEALAQ